MTVMSTSFEHYLNNPIPEFPGEFLVTPLLSESVDQNSHFWPRGKGQRAYFRGTPHRSLGMKPVSMSFFAGCLIIKNPVLTGRWALRASFLWHSQGKPFLEDK